jgi:uncharacterized protein (TIGR02996 family)
MIDIYQTDEWRALLRSICEVPHDDLPRLVAADWLDEHERSVPCGCDNGAIDSGGETLWGEPVNIMCLNCNGTGYVSNGCAERAEFLRVECKVASLKGDVSRDLIKRDSDLLFKYVYDCKEWSQDCTKSVFGPKWLQESVGTEWWWNRGFVFKIRLSGLQFEQYATELFTQHPITEVVLSGRKPFRDGANHSQTWWWSPPTTGRTAENYLDVLPQKIIDRIRKKFGVGAPYDPGFTSYELAMKALSDVCVSIGRELAKLPPLDAV